MANDAEVEIATSIRTELGESPLWSERRQRLFWVDTTGGNIHALHVASGETSTWATPAPVGMLAESPAGGLIAAIGNSLAKVSDAGEIERIGHAPHGTPDTRLNDGVYDTACRLWIGLMHNDLKTASGCLYCYTPDGQWHVMARGFTLINGMAWRKKGRELLVTESRPGALYRYAFDRTRGNLGTPQCMAQLSPALGYPDGLIRWTDDSFLSVLFDGGAIADIDTTGGLRRLFSLPVSRPTSCVHVPTLGRLFITSARFGLEKPCAEDGALMALPIQPHTAALDTTAP